MLLEALSYFWRLSGKWGASSSSPEAVPKAGLPSPPAPQHLLGVLNPVSPLTQTPWELLSLLQPREEWGASALLPEQPRGVWPWGEAVTVLGMLGTSCTSPQVPFPCF